MVTTGEQYRHKGKYGFPSRAFQITVDHTTRVLAMTATFRGTVNDMSICKDDPFIRAIHGEQIYQDEKFQLYDSNGELQAETGLYLICDNGYPR